MDFQLLSRGIGYPYAIISDVHLHNWSAYSHPNKRGINNRLQQILDGIEQTATELLKAGGVDLIITGDLFHSRGNIKPSVFNPAFELFQDLSARGIRVHALPGNHDLEGKHSERLSNSVLALSAIPEFYVYNEPTIVDEEFLFIPWYDNHKEVLNLATKGTKLFPNLTLFIHVGLSGVLKGNVGHTLDPAELEKLGVKYVFSGHFHNHVGFNSRVYSVGALTHQTWGDVDSLAGFLIVTKDKVKHIETAAPKFVDWNKSHAGRHVCNNNYIRIKDVELTESEAEDFIKTYMSYGALAIQDQSTRPSIIKKKTETRVSLEFGLDSALEAYCKNTYGDKWEEVLNACLKLKS